jgi:hypothetical protein
MTDAMLELIPTESDALAREAMEYCQSVQSVEIKTNEQAESASKLFREVNSYITKLDAERKKVKEPHLQAGKAVDDFFKEASVPLLNLKVNLDKAIRGYQKVLEDKRREEQEKLNRAAEEARRKQEEAARIQREKEEAALRAEEEARRRAAEAANEADRQAALAEAEAQRKEAAKAAASAQAKESKAEQIVAPIAQTVVPKADGISYRSNWKIEVVDEEQFVQWAINSNKTHLLSSNESACNAYAKLVKTPQTFPWGRFYDAGKLSGRAI